MEGRDLEEVAVMVPPEMVLVGVAYVGVSVVGKERERVMGFVGVLVPLVAVVGRDTVVVTIEDAVWRDVGVFGGGGKVAVADCSLLRVMSDDRVLVPPGTNWHT